MNALREAQTAAEIMETTNSPSVREQMCDNARAWAAIAQVEQTKRLADSYEALLQFNKENMEQSRKQSAELSAKIGTLLDTLAGLEE